MPATPAPITRSRCARSPICGDARREADYAALLGRETADLVFTDPPYNVAIDGDVCDSGRIKHAEFAMASGEMSAQAFTAFLTESLGAMAAHSGDGAIAFVCMDWRHMGELLAAGSAVFTELKNLCVWNKTNGGMGTFLSLQARTGVRLEGRHGIAHQQLWPWRYRTLSHHVWDYPGISSIGSSRADELAMHPTVKPVAMVADAIRDCSRRGDIVLDGFGSSGSTLIAAETCGRAARLIDYEPGYCDVIVERWQRLTGKYATLAATGERFEMRRERSNATTDETAI